MGAKEMKEIETPEEFVRRLGKDGLQGNLYGLLCSVKDRDALIRKQDANKAVGYVWPDGPEDPLEPEGLRAAIVGKEVEK